MDYSEANYKWYRCYCCGNNHVHENCPFLLTLYCIADDFTRQQTYVDNISRPSWNFEQDECWNPHVDSYSHAIDPPFMSYSDVQENIDYENSCLERLDRLERLVNTCLTMQEENLKRHEKCYNSSGSSVQRNSFSFEDNWKRLEAIEDSLKSLNDSFNRCESIENRVDHAVEEDLETCLKEIDGCLIDVENVNSNACDSDIHVDVSVPITTLDYSPITFVTLTDEGQIDFIGCSLFLERHTSNCLYEHILIPLKSVIACSLKLSMIEKAQVITLIDHLYCLKRNEDEVIMVFDTYD